MNAASFYLYLDQVPPFPFSQIHLGAVDSRTFPDIRLSFMTMDHAKSPSLMICLVRLHVGLFRLSKRARKNPNTLLRHNLRSESQLAHFGLLLDYLLPVSSVTKISAHTTGRLYRTLSDSRKYCVNSSWYASAEYTRYLPSEISQAGGVHHLVLTSLVFL